MEKFKRDSDCVEYGTWSNLKGSGVYCIENINTKLKYVGSSKNIDQRIIKHFSELRFNRHTNLRLQSDFNKYGFSSFKVTVLEYVEDTNLLLTTEVSKQLEIGKDALYNDIISGSYITTSLSKVRASSHKNTHKSDEYRAKMVALKTKYAVVKIDMTTNIVVETFESIELIADKYPTFSVNTIRGVCNGSKNSYAKYYWRYVDKQGNIVPTKWDNEQNKDIV